MAVSQKKIKPGRPDISESIRFLNGESEIRQNNPRQIQTGAGDAKNSEENSQIQKKSSVKDTQIIFRTTEENKNRLKGFFAAYGITLSKGIQLACFYLEQQIKDGNVEINAAGLMTKNNR